MHFRYLSCALYAFERAVPSHESVLRFACRRSPAAVACACRLAVAPPLPCVGRMWSRFVQFRYVAVRCVCVDVCETEKVRAEIGLDDCSHRSDAQYVLSERCRTVLT